MLLLVRVPSSLDSDRTSVTVTYSSDDLLPAVSVVLSALCSALTNDDYLPSCNDSSSLSWLSGSGFTLSEAAEVSIAHPRRRNRRQEVTLVLVWVFFVI